MKELSVAIIIPVRRFNDRLNKCIEECLKLDYPGLEIIVFPDEAFPEFKGEIKVKVIPTGPVGPAIKRDRALEYSQAELFAFIDDDAYPQTDWLRNAVKHFAAPDVAAVGGPSVTPPGSPLLEVASGSTFSQAIVSGPYTYRYVPGEKVLEVDDYPSCNFIVRRSVFASVGGFDSSFYPGEDTKLCLDITKKLGKKIIYDPGVVVFHHRRDSISGHVRQIENYAVHRGNFAKRYPETSRKLVYFVPSFFVFLLVSGFVLSLLVPSLRIIFGLGFLCYWGLLAVSAFKSLMSDKALESQKKKPLLLLVMGTTFLTHWCYGVSFLRGLMLDKLKEER